MSLELCLETALVKNQDFFDYASYLHFHWKLNKQFASKCWMGLMWLRVQNANTDIIISMKNTVCHSLQMLFQMVFQLKFKLRIPVPAVIYMMACLVLSITGILDLRGFSVY